MARRFGHLARLLNLTAPPASPGAGDVWYRSDTDQFRGSDGLTGEQLTLGPYGTHPVVRSTGWHSVPPTGNPASANILDQRLFAMPLWPGRTCTLTAIAANVTTALIGTTLRMGIYTSDGVLPTTLLSDFGTVSSGVLGTAQISALSVSVRPVLHYLAFVRQGAVGTLAVSIRNTWDPIIANASAVIAANRTAYYVDGVAGALPASFGAPAGTDLGPALSVQLT